MYGKVESMKTQVIGYFEEWLITRLGSPTRCAGSKTWGPGKLPEDQIGRDLGYKGAREFVLTEKVWLKRNSGKDVLVTASKDNPVKVLTMLHAMEGPVRE